MSLAIPENLCGQMEIAPAMLFGIASFPDRDTMRRRLQRDVGLAIALMSRQTDSMARQLISCRTKEEFCQLRIELFPKYVNASFAVSSMIRSVLTKADHAETVQESLASITKAFRSEVAAYLGTEGKGEVLFCLSTMRRAVSMLRFVQAREAPLESREKDTELARSFATQTIFFQLNLDCLRLALISEGSVNPEVLEKVLESLRASVLAYAAVREGMELRGFSEEKYAEIPDMSWDDEDEALAKF